MIVKVKKLNELAKMPKRAEDGSAGMDVYAISKKVLDNGVISYGIGLAFEFSRNDVMLNIFSRSSVHKTGLIQCNSVAVGDPSYRGEYFINFYRVSTGYDYEIGERIGQIIFTPFCNQEFLEIKEVNKLSDTKRGFGGFGSTGRF